MFSSDKRKVHSRVDIKEVKKLTPRDYTPNGLTALLDTIGSTVNEIHNRHLELPDNEVPEKTMVIITTDGYENASKEYKNEDINSAILFHLPDHMSNYVLVLARQLRQIVAKDLCYILQTKVTNDFELVGLMQEEVTNMVEEFENED